MHVAFAFGRPDVDALLDELSVEQLDEWIAYDALYPSGWRATKLAAARTAWASLQQGNPKRVDERKLLIRLSAEGPLVSDFAKRFQMEAFAVRTEIAERLATAAKIGATDG